MEPVNVLVTLSWIDKECQRQIANVSPRVNLRDASELLAAEQRGDFSSKEQFDALLADTEVIFGFKLPQNVIARAPRLKWIQANSAGVDILLDDDAVRKSPVIMTRTKGFHDTAISEFVIGLMLLLVKQAPMWFRVKQEKQWKTVYSPLLCSKTVGIVGMGSIGREIARLSKAVGMRVIATRRTVKQATQEENADMVLPAAQLPRLLAESDFVVIAAALTPETRNMIGEKELRMMKPTAFLINIARGAIVDEEALIRALEENWIAGAGLDVFVTEPLPPESKLWELPNVILSHHSSALELSIYFVKATEQFCENLARYLNGEQLLDVVDKQLGY